jgi:hypothetical protein
MWQLLNSSELLWLVRSVVSDIPADLIIHVNNTKYQLHKVRMLFFFYLYAKGSDHRLLLFNTLIHSLEECWSNSSSFIFEVLRQIYICLRFSDPKVVSRNLQVNWNPRINLMQCKEHLSLKAQSWLRKHIPVNQLQLQPLVKAQRFDSHYLLQKLQIIKAFDEHRLGWGCWTRSIFL